MTRFLQTETFAKIPPAMLQSLLIKMESFPVEAGDIVIHQGDPGDYFYTIREGRCAVTRKDSLDTEDQLLTELGNGSSFGEEALVSDAVRNATVTMLTDGLLMRLSKTDFIELLKNQLVNHIDYDQAVTMVNEGAIWLDLRTKEEYECGSCDEDSVNIPLSDLRDEMSELVFNTKYIIYGETSGSSESAAFLLSHHGFDVYVLEGGIPEYSSGAGTVKTSMEDIQAADVSDNIHRIQSSEHTEELATLRSENERLLAEIEKYQSSEARMREQIQQQRDELCELGEKLESMHAKMSGNA
jgi:rhodanese-related sulfurtransferase